MNCPSPAPSSTYASMAPALIHTDLEHAYRLGTQRLEEWGVHTVVPVLGDLVRAGIGQRRNKAWPFISFTRPSTRLRMHAFGCSLWKRYRQRSRASEQASDEHGRWELVQHLARYHMPRTEIGQRCGDCGISATYSNSLFTTRYIGVLIYLECWRVNAADFSGSDGSYSSTRLPDKCIPTLNITYIATDAQ